MEYCDEDTCPYKRILSLLGKAYSFSILRILSQEGVLRFNEITSEVKGSPKTITDRLTELTSEGIVKREAFAEIPPRVEYSLTDMGNDLKPIIEHIRSWALKWTCK